MEEGGNILPAWNVLSADSEAILRYCLLFFYAN